MRLGLLTALLLAASPGFAQVEAVSFDRPMLLVDPRDGAARWASDGGTCFQEPAYDKVDAELTRLQRVEADRTDSRKSFFLGGVVVGGVTVSVIAIVVGVAVFAVKR